MSSPIQYILLVTMGFLPSLFWLFFYLRKDTHPEPRYLITRTFFMGIAVAPVAAIAQYLLSRLITYLVPGVNIDSYPGFYLGAAFIEEFVKFLVIQLIIIHNTEFDEPIDAMEYMIIGALGFAAIENILALINTAPSGARFAVEIWFQRFAGAVFLHALASAIVGYFLALSWFYRKHSEKLVPAGLIIATVVHFIFNGIVLNPAPDSATFLSSSIFLVITAVLISVFFLHLKKKSENDKKRNFSTLNV